MRRKEWAEDKQEARGAFTVHHFILIDMLPLGKLSNLSFYIIGGFKKKGCREILSPKGLGTTDLPLHKHQRTRWHTTVCHSLT